jgi:polar amino acid transport system substrate-binding protein
MPTLKHLVASACLALLASGTRAEDIITLSNGEWLPYLSETAPHYGVISRIVTEAFALEGVKVRYVFRPWSRAFAEAATGKVQGSVVWSEGLPGTVRATDFYYSDTVFDGQSVFFYLKAKPFNWTTFADLAKVKIGGTAGYEYKFERVPHVTIDRAATDELNFRKLLAGRFQVFPANLDNGRLILRENFTPEEAARITVHPRPYAITHYHLIMSKKLAGNERYVELFNRGLRRLKDNGKFAQYMDDLKKGGYR